MISIFPPHWREGVCGYSVLSLPRYIRSYQGTLSREGFEGFVFQVKLFKGDYTREKLRVIL